MKLATKLSPARFKPKPKLHIVAFLSARAIGKSTLLKTTMCLYGPSYSGLDCSALCHEHSEKDTPIGRSLLSQRNDRDHGGLYRDETVVAATFEKIEWERQSHLKQSNSEMHGVFAAGIPRKLRQLKFLTGMGFDVSLVHIVGTLRQSFIGVKRRQIEELDKPDGVVRTDGSLKAVLKSWEMYQEAAHELTLALPAHKVLRIDKETPFGKKVRQLVDFADFPHRELAINALYNPHHDIHMKIEEVESRVATPITLDPDVEEYLEEYERNSAEHLKEQGVEQHGLLLPSFRFNPQPA